MRYKLIITERAEQLLDGLVCYLLHQLKNQQATIHFLDQIESLYNCLQENPYQFPECEDEYLMYKGYREAVFPRMKYVIIYRIEHSTVYILGVFHQLEQYNQKI